MPEAKSYVIGIIEIDPVAECQQTWVTLAGDDDTLEEVLTRLAGGTPSQDMKTNGRTSTLPEHVAANLTKLSADLDLRLAEIRGRLAAAGSM